MSRDPLLCRSLLRLSRRPQAVAAALECIAAVDDVERLGVNYAAVWEALEVLRNVRWWPNIAIYVGQTTRHPLERFAKHLDTFKTLNGCLLQVIAAVDDDSLAGVNYAAVWEAVATPNDVPPTTHRCCEAAT